MTVFVDPELPSPLLRQRIYDGDVVILTNLPSVADLVDYTREQLVDLFRPHDQERAHEHIDKAEMASLLGSCKPRFIHTPRSKELVCNARQASPHRGLTTMSRSLPRPFPWGT